MSWNLYCPVLLTEKVQGRLQTGQGQTFIHKQGPFLHLKSYLIIQHDHKTIDSLEYCYENFSFPASEIME